MTISENRRQVLVLRTCRSDMTSHNGFVWPSEGHVEAPDWDPAPRCGGGLHGLAWGEGDATLLNWSPTAVWLVVEVNQDDIVDLRGKIKFPTGNVIFAGTREEAVGRIAAHPEARGHAIVGATITAGDYGTATAGYGGTAVAGDYGTATAGDFGTATAGDFGTATAGDGGTATAGDGGTATVGYAGCVAAGDGGVISIRRVSPDGKLAVHAAAVGGDIRPNVLYWLEWLDGDVRFATVVREEQP